MIEHPNFTILLDLVDLNYGPLRALLFTNRSAKLNWKSIYSRANYRKWQKRKIEIAKINLHWSFWLTIDVIFIMIESPYFKEET